MWNTPSPPALWGSLAQAYCFVPEEAPRSHSVGPLPPTLILPCGPTRTSTQALRTQCSQSGCHTPMPTYMALMSSCGEHQKLPGSGKSKPVPWCCHHAPHLPFATVCSQQAKFMMQGLPVCGTLLSDTPLPVYLFPYAGLCGAIASCRHDSSLQEGLGLGGNCKCTEPFDGVALSNHSEGSLWDPEGRWPP